MSSTNDFIIKNGVLKDYKGPGGDVTIPAGVTSIGSSAFQVCGLTSVTIPEGVTSIGSFAFSGCSGLTSVTIPDSVTSIGGFAFFGCNSLTSVTIPEGVTSIGNRAFDGCSSLTSVTIPEGVTSIEGSAFQGCRSLADAQGFVIIRGCLYCYMGPRGSVAVPENVTRIGRGAFADCSSLSSVTIPDSVTSIGNSAFSGCSGLTSVTIPEGVTSIGNYAFSGCSGLTSVTIPESVTSIDDNAFDECRGLKSVLIPHGVICIGNSAFHGCSALTSVKIPDSVTSIGISAFSHCSGLTSVTIPEGMTSIGDFVFQGCSSLKSVTIPDSVASIGDYAFSFCSGLTSVTIPESVTSIGDKAFCGCSKLTSVTIPKSVTSIGSSAFSDCSGLTSVTIPDSVTSIAAWLFYGCSRLQMLLFNELQFRQILNSGIKETALVIQHDENVWYLAYSSKAESNNLKDFGDAGQWPGYDMELINNGPVYKYRMPARLLGALGRLLDPVELTEENRALYVELLNKNAKKLVPIAEELRFPRILIDLFSLGILDAKTDKTVRRLLSDSSVPEIAQLAETAILETAMKEKKSMPKQVGLPPAWKNPLKEKYADKLRAIKGDAVINKMKLWDISMPKALLKDGSEAPEELFRFLLASYGSQLGGKYRFDPEADEAAALLRYDTLCEAMDAVSRHLDGPNYPAALPLLCRFGNVQQIQALTDAWKSWGNWERYNRRGRTAQETLEAAMVLSNTREAVIWLEKHGGLTQYAALRGMSAQDARDLIGMADLGFDADGTVRYELGSTVIEARLTKELTLELFDKNGGKTLRTFPKAGVDPKAGEAAAKAFAELKKSLKAFVRQRSEQLSRMHVYGESISPKIWNDVYMKHPVIRLLSERVIWMDESGKCFTVQDGSAADVAGSPYIPAGRIRVAHVMDMTEAETEAWRQVLAGKRQSLLIEQVWEPAMSWDGKSLPQRFSGAVISSKERNQLKTNLKRRGIEVYSDEIGREFNPRTGQYEYATENTMRLGRHIALEYEVYEANGDLTLGRLRVPRQIENIRRELNAVLFELERAVTRSRIARDDAEALQENVLDSFTVAQITAFIDEAVKAKALNCTSLLMNYKNKRYPDYSGSFDFVLEW